MTSRNKFISRLWIALHSINIAFTLVLYQVLPEMVAIHFDLYGRPNNWVNKGSFLAINIGLIVFVNAVMLVVSRWIDRMGVQYINVPYKNLWLQRPNGEQELLEVARNIIALAAVYIGIVLLLCLFTIYLLNVVNPGLVLSPSLVFPVILLLTGGLLFFTFRLARPPR